MAWPASVTTIRSAFDNVNAAANRCKALVQTARNQSAAGPINRSNVVSIIKELDRAIGIWNAAVAIPGMSAYARDQFANQAIDVAAEFTAMTAAAATLRDWIFANFPKDAVSGAALLSSIDAAGNETPLTFTTAQLATFRTNADTFTATIG
jgi:hypothetical protein